VDGGGFSKVSPLFTPPLTVALVLADMVFGI
jgi:hypothetical protein